MTSMVSSRAAARFYSSIETAPAPHIPEPAPPLVLFPRLEDITAQDLTLQKNTPEKNGWYNITRTRGNQLPVYSEVRANGHRRTVIRRVEGSLPLLKDDLKRALFLESDAIKIKPTSNQIIIRGDYVKEIRSLFREASL